MPNKPTLSYQQLAQFNITKMFQQYFDNGKTIDSTILDNIDFSEESKKTVTLYEGKRLHQYNIEESLALNIVSYLEPEAYIQYISSSWIDQKSFKSNDNPIKHLLFFQKYDIVKKFLDITLDEAIVENDFDEHKNKLFRNKCIGNILNLPNQLYHFSTNSEAKDNKSIQNYFDLFVYALDKYQSYSEKVKAPNYFLSSKDKHKKESIDLMQELKNILNVCRVDTYAGGSGDVWINHLFEEKKFLKFLDLLGNENNNYLFDPSNLECTITHSNTKAINYWLSHNLDLSEDIHFIINKDLKKFIDNIYESPSTTDVLNNIRTHIKFYEFLTKKNLFSIDKIDEQNLLFFFLDKPNTFSKQILEKNPDIFNNLKIESLDHHTFVEPISLHNLISYHDIMQKFTKEYDYQITPFEPSYYSNKAVQQKFYLENISATNFTSKLLATNYIDKMHNESSINHNYDNFAINFKEEALHYLSPVNKNMDDLPTQIEFFLLNHTLGSSNTSNKKLKI